MSAWQIEDLLRLSRGMNGRSVAISVSISTSLSYLDLLFGISDTTLFGRMCQDTVQLTSKGEKLIILNYLFYHLIKFFTRIKFNFNFAFFRSGHFDHYFGAQNFSQSCFLRFNIWIFFAWFAM